MENFNLGNLEKQVACKYNDMKGVFAINFIDGAMAIYKLLELKGVETKPMFIVGWRISENEHHFGLTSNNCSLTVYYFENEDNKNYDQIHDDNKTDKQKPKEVQVSLLYTDLFTLIKRLDMIAVTSMNDLDLDFTENQSL